MSTNSILNAVSRPPLIFGREPVVIASAIEALIAFAGVVLFHWTTDQVTAVSTAAAAVMAIVVAILTRDSLLAVGVGLIKALVIAMAGFGINLPPDQVALFIGLFSAVLMAWQRTQTSPAGTEPATFPPAPDGTQSVTSVTGPPVPTSPAGYPATQGGSPTTAPVGFSGMGSVHVYPAPGADVHRYPVNAGAAVAAVAAG